MLNAHDLERLSSASFIPFNQTRIVSVLVWCGRPETARADVITTVFDHHGLSTHIFRGLNAYWNLCQHIVGYGAN